ncbi:exonuclease domain-containing protein [Kitasatospora sp. NPDC058048]|uniref:exonuclease domain-containing protein n=1 Tax=Kitasatospora sp. NPDC058048 TaxID=3346313 RepID=UPI0036DC64A0
MVSGDGLVPRGEPLRFDGGVPVFDSGRAPAGLRTKTQLGRQRRLKPAPGQVPVAYVVTQFYAGQGGHRYEQRALFDPAGAVRMRPLPSRLKAEMEARRTCPVCSVVGESIVRGGRCDGCRRRAEESARRLRVRTCEGCRRQRRKGRPFPSVRERHWSRRLCAECRRAAAAKRREEEARWLERVVVCNGGCGVRLVTLREARAWLRAHGLGAYWQPRVCAPCGERREAERAVQDAELRARWAEEDARREEREQERLRARLREVEGLEAWAAGVLADPRCAVLDCESTGLGSDARIVDLAVVSVVGREVLLDSLVDPGVPIPSDAERVHGINDVMVAGAPAFGDLVERLGRVVAGRRILIFNRSYDVGLLRHELGLYFLDQVAREAADGVFAAGEVPEGLRERALAEASARVEAWMGAASWEDVMLPYSDWVGEERYDGTYRWQRLNGGHRALGDCLAVTRRLEEMAHGTVDERV